jgi:hypothetical protein
MIDDGKKFWEGPLNIYLKAPILLDFVLGLIVSILMYKFGTGLQTRDNQENNILYLISADVSLSGFVIAALTILVTVKASTQYKKIEEMKTGVELLFNLPLYKDIIKIFLGCIAEFVIIAFLLFVLNFYNAEKMAHVAESIFFAALLMSFLSASRAIGILATAVIVQARSN